MCIRYSEYCRRLPPLTVLIRPFWYPNTRSHTHIKRVKINRNACWLLMNASNKNKYVYETFESNVVLWLKKPVRNGSRSREAKAQSQVRPKQFIDVRAWMTMMMWNCMMCLKIICSGWGWSTIHAQQWLGWMIGRGRKAFILRYYNTQYER